MGIPRSETKDWIREVICCPECGGCLEAKLDDNKLICTTENCDYSAERDGTFLNLLPNKLNDFQKAENEIHQKRIKDLEKRFLKNLGVDNFATLNLLNTTTSYRFTSQFHFFRDYFVQKHQLSGRGLELGGAACHQSGFIRLFYPETEMVTSDVAPINTTLARKLATYLNFETDYFVLADAERLAFQPNSFDFIFSSGMLHHLGDIKKGLLSARSALKPGGKWYIINELAIGSLPRLYWNSRFGQKGKWASKAGIHEKSYRLGEWKQIFREAGFELEEIHFHRTPSHKLVSWSRAAYYSLISKIPVSIIKMGLPCEVNFVLEKPLDS